MKQDQVDRYRQCFMDSGSVAQWKEVRRELSAEYGLDYDAYRRRETVAVAVAREVGPRILAREWVVADAFIRGLTVSEYLRLAVESRIAMDAADKERELGYLEGSLWGDDLERLGK